VITAFGPLNINFALGTELCVLLPEMDLAGPVFEHAVALTKLIARDCVMPRRMTLKTPNQLAFNALNFGQQRIIVGRAALTNPHFSVKIISWTTIISVAVTTTVHFVVVRTHYMRTSWTSLAARVLVGLKQIFQIVFECVFVVVGHSLADLVPMYQFGAFGVRTLDFDDATAIFYFGLYVVVDAVVARPELAAVALVQVYSVEADLAFVF
jgi:hypothetical protein